MKYTRSNIALLSFIFIAACNSGRTPYNTIQEKVGSPHKGQYITLIYYTPLQCMGCNTALMSAVKNDGRYNNAFIVFPSIRDIELNDYMVSLRSQCGISINTINDKRIYNEALALAHADIKNDAKPLVLVFSPYSGKVFSFEMKDPQLAQKLTDLKKAKM